MILNGILLVVLFSIPKKKLNPFAAAGILGGIKAALYALLGGSVLLGLIMGLIFFGLGSCFAYFMGRIDAQTTAESRRSTKSSFKWEYLPITASILLIVFGEALLTLEFSHA